MLCAAVFAIALAGLALLAGGVLDAAPLVFWGSREELASVARGRSAMLAGAGLTLVAATAFAGLREVRAGAANGPVWGVLVAGGITLGGYLQARAGGPDPRAAAASLLPGAGYAALT